MEAALYQSMMIIDTKARSAFSACICAILHALGRRFLKIRLTKIYFKRACLHISLGLPLCSILLAPVRLIGNYMWL
jgi:hypothetical protein